MVYDVTICIWQHQIIVPGPSFAFFSLLRLRLRETKWTFQALGVHINHVPTMTNSWLFMDPIYASAVLRPHRKHCNVYCVTCAMSRDFALLIHNSSKLSAMSIALSEKYTVFKTTKTNLPMPGRLWSKGPSREAKYWRLSKRANKLWQPSLPCHHSLTLP